MVWLPNSCESKPELAQELLAKLVNINPGTVEFMV